MLSGVLCVPVDHDPGLPAAEILQLVAASSCLPVPRGPHPPTLNPLVGGSNPATTYQIPEALAYARASCFIPDRE